MKGICTHPATFRVRPCRHFRIAQLTYVVKLLETTPFMNVPSHLLAARMKVCDKWLVATATIRQNRCCEAFTQGLLGNGCDELKGQFPLHLEAPQFSYFSLGFPYLIPMKAPLDPLFNFSMVHSLPSLIFFSKSTTRKNSVFTGKSKIFHEFQFFGSQQEKEKGPSATKVTRQNSAGKTWASAVFVFPPSLFSPPRDSTNLCENRIFTENTNGALLLLIFGAACSTLEHRAPFVAVWAHTYWQMENVVSFQFTPIFHKVLSKLNMGNC